MQCPRRRYCVLRLSYIGPHTASYGVGCLLRRLILLRPPLPLRFCNLCAGFGAKGALLLRGTPYASWSVVIAGTAQNGAHLLKT